MKIEILNSHTIHTANITAKDGKTYKALVTSDGKVLTFDRLAIWKVAQAKENKQ